MNKNLFLIGAGILMFASVSCDRETTSVQTNTIQLCSLVTSLDGNEDVTVSETSYTLKLDYGNNTLSTSTTNLEVGGNKYSFATDEIPGKNSYDEKHGNVLKVSSPSAGMASGNGQLPISDFTCEIYSAAQYELPYIPNMNISTGIYQPVILGFNLGNYKVRTFQKDVFFTGQTETEFRTQSGELSNFSTKGTMYRVIMDVDKKKATVIIYQAKFAEQMPEQKVMILNDLDLSFSSAGYTVSGKDIIPSVVEGVSATPNDNFPFTTFQFSTTGDKLTNVIGSYVVAGRFNGFFSGSSIPQVVSAN